MEKRLKREPIPAPRHSGPATAEVIRNPFSTFTWILALQDAVLRDSDAARTFNHYSPCLAADNAFFPKLYPVSYGAIGCALQMRLAADVRVTISFGSISVIAAILFATAAPAVAGAEASTGRDPQHSALAHGVYFIPARSNFDISADLDPVLQVHVSGSPL